MPAVVVCEECGEKLSSRRIRENAKYCDMDCYSQARTGRSRGGPSASAVCEECGEIYKGSPSILKDRRWCSWQCRTARPRDFSGVEKDRRTCGVCDETFDVVPSSTRKYCSWDCATVGRGRTQRVPRVRVQCQQCGKTEKVYPSWAKRRKYCSRRCAALGRPIRKSSKIANRAIRIWRETASGDDGVTEYRVGRYALDLAFPDQKIAIELDGEYWHALPDMQERDDRKDAFLAGRGWDVRRIVMQKHHTAEDVAALISEAMEDDHWSHQMEFAV